MLDVAFFSYNNHQHLLIPGLQNIIKHVPSFRHLILVWDDYVQNKPIDFNQVQQQIDYPIKVVKHSDLDPWPQCIGEWGWIKQQLVKLRCIEYSDAEYVWICDGDVMVIGDPQLFRNNQPVLRYDNKRRRADTYTEFINKYFGIDNFNPTHNWVGSTCLFDAEVCREIWKTCFARNGQSLIDCVAETIQHRTNDWPFSEFDLYGSFCYNAYRDKFYITEKNWNYAPNREGLTDPIQIMWHNFHKDLDKAKQIACTHQE